MSGFAPLYGHDGLMASGDPQVAELLNRTVDQQPRATGLHDETVAALRAATTSPWTQPVPTLAVMYSRWLSAMLWQMASCYLDNMVATCWDNGQLPTVAYKECDALCDLATEATLQAVRLKSALDQGQKPANVSLTPLPNLSLTAQTYAGVWGTFQAIATQVAADFALIESLGYPKQMQTVYQTARQAYQPQADAFSFLQTTWSTVRTVDSQQQVVRDALPVIQSLFAIGQQLWAPYLLGPVYAAALRYQPTLEDVLQQMDPWILTDPAVKLQRQKDDRSKQELTNFWMNVADPATATQVMAQLAEATRTRRLRLRVGRGYPNVPWPSQYLVHYPFSIGSRTFQSGDLIAVYASQNEDNKIVLEVRKTGRVTSTLELLGQSK